MSKAIINTIDNTTKILCDSHFAEYIQRHPLIAGSHYTHETDQECESCSCPATVRNPSTRPTENPFPLTIEMVAHDFDLDLLDENEQHTAHRIYAIFRAAYDWGLEGYWPDQEFASDADWCNGPGIELRKLADELDDDADQVGHAFDEWHALGLQARELSLV